MSRFIKLILLLAVAGIAYLAYGRFAGGPGGAPGMDMMGGAPPVNVAQVVERPVQQWQEFSGRLVAVESAEIRARVLGVIEKVHFQEGQWVEAGAPLFTIDQRPYTAALEAAQAQSTLAHAELARAKTLIADKAIPQREYDQRKNAAESAKAALTQAKLNYDYSVINAPIAGRVSRAELTVGNLIDAGGNSPVLTTIVSNKPIYADFDIDERTYLRYLENAGQDIEQLKTIPAKLSLATEDGTFDEGHVQSFDNQVDVRSGTVRVRTVFENEKGALIPGLFARVSLGTTGSSKELLINDRAVGTDQSKKFVLVVGENNTLEYREIQLGGMAEGLRVVAGGLKAGETIVVNGLQRVRPGIPVTPQVVPMDAPETSAEQPAIGSPEGETAPAGEKAEEEVPQGDS